MPLAFLALFLAGTPAVPREPASLLPAYAHNDYRDSRPLDGALDRGYRGVEVDLFRAGGDLLVGHRRSEISVERSFRRLYLDGLRTRLGTRGSLLPDSSSFLLTLELKEEDPEAFRLLVRILDAYPELFRPSRSGVAPAVSAVLVGWWPSLPAAQWPKTLRRHLAFPEPFDAAAPSPPRIGLVTMDHRRSIRWEGWDRPTPAAVAAMARARTLAQSLGVPLRVHHAPLRPRVVRWLLSQGVALIGVMPGASFPISMTGQEPTNDLPRSASTPPGS